MRRERADTLTRSLPDPAGPGSPSSKCFFLIWETSTAFLEQSFLLLLYCTCVFSDVLTQTIPCRCRISQMVWPATFIFHWKKWGKVFSLGAAYYCPQNMIERACLEKWGPHFDPYFETIDFQVSKFSHIINLSIFAEFCLYPKM